MRASPDRSNRIARATDARRAPGRRSGSKGETSGHRNQQFRGSRNFFTGGGPHADVGKRPLAVEWQKLRGFRRKSPIAAAEEAGGLSSLVTLERGRKWKCTES